MQFLLLDQIVIFESKEAVPVDGKQNCGISQPLSFTLPWQVRSSEGQTVGQAPGQLVPSTPVGPVFDLKRNMQF